jgi:hypothetical protein
MAMAAAPAMPVVTTVMRLSGNQKQLRQDEK